MNKTLIAMAVAGVMAAPMAAQADATVYGKIHVSIDFGDNGGSDSDAVPNTATAGDDPSNNSAPGSNASDIYWQSNSGRIGFKGSEDLGGGLQAVWQFESNASFGSGNTSWGGRNSYLGLKGDWGTLLGGKHDTPFKTTGRKFDLFGDYVGDSRNIIGMNGWDLRLNNTIAYKSPKFGGGFDVVAAYVLEDGTTDQDALSASLNWKTGDWFASLAYETHGKGWNEDFGTDGNSNSETGIRLGAKWTPGAWIINAFYQTLTDLEGYSGVDSDAFGLGVGYKMGKNVLKAQYYANDNTVPGGSTEINGSTMAVGWDYNMSKRTTAYIAYAATSNDADVDFTVDGGGHGGEIGSNDGKDATALSLGMIHKF